MVQDAPLQNSEQPGSLDSRAWRNHFPGPILAWILVAVFGTTSLYLALAKGIIDHTKAIITIFIGIGAAWLVIRQYKKDKLGTNITRIIKDVEQEHNTRSAEPFDFKRAEVQETPAGSGVYAVTTHGCDYIYIWNNGQVVGRRTGQLRALLDERRRDEFEKEAIRSGHYKNTEE